MKRTNALIIGFILLAVLPFSLPAEQNVRIKDIAYIQGVRENQLTGFGLVTGLSGKGDSDNSLVLQTVLSNLLSSFGLEISPNEIKSKNCAVVMVTADIPPFIRPGDRIPINVSSMGDAKSLEGGILLLKKLLTCPAFVRKSI